MNYAFNIKIIAIIKSNGPSSYIYCYVDTHRTFFVCVNEWMDVKDGDRHTKMNTNEFQLNET
jgi:hypothetical protein